MAVYDRDYEHPGWRYRKNNASNLTKYSREELNVFASVLDAASTEAALKGIELPIDLMSRRLFDAASRGERAPHKLRAAIFREAVPAI